MLPLYENIKARRKELKMTQEELSIKVGYSNKSMISLIEKGAVDLPQSKIVDFAKALNTTPSYLMGWEGESEKLDAKEVIAKNITYYMERKGITRNKLCDDLGFKYSTVSEWINARKYPRIDYIEKMANYFGIKKSDLIESKEEHPTIDIDAELSALLARIDGGKSISLHGELLDDTSNALVVDSLTNMLKLLNALAKKA